LGKRHAALPHACERAPPSSTSRPATLPRCPSRGQAVSLRRLGSFQTIEICAKRKPAQQLFRPQVAHHRAHPPILREIKPPRMWRQMRLDVGAKLVAVEAGPRADDRPDEIGKNGAGNGRDLVDQDPLDGVPARPVASTWSRPYGRAARRARCRKRTARRVRAKCLVDRRVECSWEGTYWSAQRGHTPHPRQGHRC
jgi:hypothetical protein